MLDDVRDASGVRDVLESLPAWFGDPAALDTYVADADDPALQCVLARRDGRTVGVALVRRHFPESAGLHLLAVCPGDHGRGIGRALVDRVVARLVEDDCRFLTVHTVGPSHADDAYARTRAFYRAVGFTPLEEHTGLDWPGPTLVLVRPLPGTRPASPTPDGVCEAGRVTDGQEPMPCPRK
nr:GNAT family N-acetyltransferase [Pseudoclavibacter chungangensis]